MPQDESAVGWDPVSLPPHVSPSLRLYILFLLVAVIVTIAKLVTLWIAAPPFRLARQASNPNYLRRLQRARVSIQQWLVCTLLGWALVASVELFETSGRLLVAKPRNPSFLLFAVRDFSLGAETAWLIAILLFLAQWHLLNRVESLATKAPGH